MQKTWVMVAVLVGAGLVADGAWAVNKCVDANGRISFQDAPCATGQVAQEVDATPSSKGVVPAAGRAAGSGAPASPGVSSSPATEPVKERPADCPDAQTMQQMQVEAESIALPLPIRKQKRQDFEDLKERCR